MIRLPRLLTVSAVLTLFGLALMVWSMIEPTPMPVMLAMSVGQMFGTVAFGLFGFVVLVDQLRKAREKGERARAEAARVASGQLPKVPTSDGQAPAGAAQPSTAARSEPAPPSSGEASR